jgi:hypothetical protein
MLSAGKVRLADDNPHDDADDLAYDGDDAGSDKAKSRAARLKYYMTTSGSAPTRRYCRTKSDLRGIADENHNG